MTDRERKEPPAPPRPAAGRSPEADTRPEPRRRAAGAPRAHAELHTIPPEWMAWSPARRSARARLDAEATAPRGAGARPPPARIAARANDAAASGANAAAHAVAEMGRPPAPPVREPTPLLPTEGPPPVREPTPLLPTEGPPPVREPTPLLPAVTASAPGARFDTPPIVVGGAHGVIGRDRRDPSDPEIAALRARETLAGEAGAVAVTPVGAPALSTPAPPFDVPRDAMPAGVAAAGGARTTARERAHLALAIAIAIGAVLGALVAGLFWVGLPATPWPPLRAQTRVIATRPARELPRALPAAGPAATPDPATLAPRAGDPAAGDAIAVGVVVGAPPAAAATAPRPSTSATARAGGAREPQPAAATSSVPRLRLVRPRGVRGTSEGKP